MDEQLTFELEARPIEKGTPELRWSGKRPFESADYCPARLRESYGTAAEDGWINRLYRGDNLCVMSHMLKDFRGKIDLIYIDPPFNSKTDYKKKITMRGQQTGSAGKAVEEKQYGDIWTNDGYLQFMYERLILMRELLSDAGSIYVHSDYHKVQYIRCIMDEVFGAGCFQRELIWQLPGVSGYKSLADNYVRGHDNILFYTKSGKRVFNKEYLPYSKAQLKRFSGVDKDGRRYKPITKDRVIYLDESKGVPVSDVWSDIASFQTVVNSPEIQNYPTQKPEALAERIIKSSSNHGGIVFDCFMGSGTTQCAAMKLGRRFIGADINTGAVHTSVKRLINLAKRLDETQSAKVTDAETSSCAGAPGRPLFTGFEVYDAEVHTLTQSVGVESKAEANADIAIAGGMLTVRQFNSPLLLEKFPADKGNQPDWRQFVDSIMIDWNYDGKVLRPAVTDVPDRKGLVSGIYEIPQNAARVRVKITDLLSESIEVEGNCTLGARIL